MKDPLKLEHQVCFRLYNLSKSMNRLYAPLLKKLDLTYPQYLVMLVLWDHQAPVNIKHIGELLDLDTGTLSPLLKRMENQNLIIRQRNQADERSVNIALTAHGKNIKKDAKQIPAKLFALTGLSIAEMTALRASLDNLMDKIKSSQ